MLPQILIGTGAAIFVLLGTIHIIYTFFTANFEARDPATSSAMKATSPVLTRRTSIWNCWIGFNASHSLGVLIFGAIYLVLALGHMSVLRVSPTLTWLPVVAGVAYTTIARRYWFINPLIGVAIATACFFAAALVLSF